MGKKKIKEIDKDVNDFLEFRKKFTRSEWDELNHVVNLVENKRANQVKLTDSDIEEIKGRLLGDFIFHSSRFVSTTEDEKFDLLMDVVDKLDIWKKSKYWGSLQSFQCLDMSFL